MLALAACGEAPVSSDKVLEPRGRVHPGWHEPGQDSLAEPADALGAEPSATGRDPRIDHAVERIRTSKLRFLAPDPDDAASPDEYTAEQFASMLESKRDWIGYDIMQFDPWLDEIASASFLDRVPYLVVLEDGTTRELRAWLVQPTP